MSAQGTAGERINNSGSRAVEVRRNRIVVPYRAGIICGCGMSGVGVRDGGRKVMRCFKIGTRFDGVYRYATNMTA